MYKTISISRDTYQDLQAIASRLDKPKSRIIEDLLKKYLQTIENDQEEKLKAYNAFVDKLAKRIKLPKGTKISSVSMDKDFSVLKDKKI